MRTTTMPRLFTMQEAQEALGCGKTTMYEYINSGVIPVVKISHKLLIRESDLCKLIDANTERRGCLTSKRKRGFLASMEA